MPAWPDDYVKYVLDDVKDYPKNNKPIKASLLERLTVKNLPPKKLHPNPMDEFSQDAVGPNFEIIGNYANSIRRNLALSMPMYDEPIIVEKMSPNDYMLINGHHRWFAALRSRAPMVWVSIVNLTHEEDIKTALGKTQNHKSVAFDLDEVLLAGSTGFSAEKPVRFVGRRSIKERFRLGTIKAINTLHEKGYDVWVYTSSYNSEKYISAIFKLYGLEVEGIINAMGRKRGASTHTLMQLIKDKYICQLHIDNESILCTYNPDGEFDQFDLSGNQDKWADDIVNALDQIKSE